MMFHNVDYYVLKSTSYKIYKAFSNHKNPNSELIDIWCQAIRNTIDNIDGRFDIPHEFKVLESYLNSLFLRRESLGSGFDVGAVYGMLKVMRIED